MAMIKEYTEAEVRLIIEGAIQEEREACAKLCDGSANEAPNSWQFRMGANHCADAIRARSHNGL
jgi:hypothetical protein